MGAPTAAVVMRPPHSELWILVPWAVFALAAAVKFWRFRRLLQRLRPRSTEQMRQSLERIWQRDQQAA